MIRKLIIFGIIILLAFLMYKSQSLRREYKNSVNQAFKLNKGSQEGVVTLEDISHLPVPVRNYLKYAGIIGKPKVNNIKVNAECQMQMGSGWSKGDFEQFNFFGDHPSRLFHLRLKMLGFVPIRALHSYTDDRASLLVKFAGVIPIVDVKGDEMRQSDTVTLFNDMCVFAPAALISDDIIWEPIDDKTVKAKYGNKHCTVSATLFFNDTGELINFTSTDRYSLEADGSWAKYEWSTPLKDYVEIDGFKLASYIEAVWDTPGGQNCYFKMTRLKGICYNPENN